VNKLYDNMDFQHTVNDNSTRKICSKGHCKIILPARSQYRQCDACRERERQLQQASRARKKAANEKITPVGQKHPRETGQSPDERPAQRARSNGDDYDSEDDKEGYFETAVRVISYMAPKKLIN